VIQELVVTSAPRGLQAGRSGFTTVLRSRGIHPDLASRLEAASAYRHIHPQGDSRNPVIFSYVCRPSAIGDAWVMSRVGDAGTDYSGRSNKIAHHIALQSSDMVAVAASNPAAVMASLVASGGLLARWSGEPRESSETPSLPAPPSQPATCSRWARAAGDAGWAGVIVEKALNRESVWIIVSPETDLLGLYDEALSLVSPSHRWQIPFTTFSLRGDEGRWLGAIAGSAEAEAARAQRRAMVIDLTRPLPSAPDGAYVIAARGVGRVPWQRGGVEQTAYGSGGIASPTRSPSLGHGPLSQSGVARHMASPVTPGGPPPVGTAQLGDPLPTDDGSQWVECKLDSLPQQRHMLAIAAISACLVTLGMATAGWCYRSNAFGVRAVVDEWCWRQRIREEHPEATATGEAIAAARKRIKAAEEITIRFDDEKLSKAIKVVESKIDELEKLLRGTATPRPEISLLRAKATELSESSSKVSELIANQNWNEKLRKIEAAIASQEVTLQAWNWLDDPEKTYFQAYEDLRDRTKKLKQKVGPGRPIKTESLEEIAERVSKVNRDTQDFLSDADSTKTKELVERAVGLLSRMGTGEAKQREELESLLMPASWKTLESKCEELAGLQWGLVAAKGASTPELTQPQPSSESRSAFDLIAKAVKSPLLPVEANSKGEWKILEWDGDADEDSLVPLKVSLPPLRVAIKSQQRLLNIEFKFGQQEKKETKELEWAITPHVDGAAQSKIGSLVLSKTIMRFRQASNTDSVTPQWWRVLVWMPLHLSSGDQFVSVPLRAPFTTRSEVFLHDKEVHIVENCKVTEFFGGQRERYPCHKLQLVLSGTPGDPQSQFRLGIKQATWRSQYDLPEDYRECSKRDWGDWNADVWTKFLGQLSQRLALPHKDHPTDKRDRVKAIDPYVSKAKNKRAQSSQAWQQDLGDHVRDLPEYRAYLNEQIVGKGASTPAEPGQRPKAPEKPDDERATPDEWSKYDTDYKKWQELEHNWTVAKQQYETYLEKRTKLFADLGELRGWCEEICRDPSGAVAYPKIVAAALWRAVDEYQSDPCDPRTVVINWQEDSAKQSDEVTIYSDQSPAVPSNAKTKVAK
jgi:hypothetical protein